MYHMAYTQHVFLERRKKKEMSILLQHRYADANKTKPKEYWNYDAYECEWGPIDPYPCTARLGRGKYSEVLEAVNVISEERCVVKVLKPVKKAISATRTESAPRRQAPQRDD